MAALVTITPETWGPALSATGPPGPAVLSLAGFRRSGSTCGRHGIPWAGSVPATPDGRWRSWQVKP